MKMRLLLLFILLAIFSPLQLLHGQNATKDKYWVYFSDKGDLSSYKASDILSEKALLRRHNQNIPVHVSDYPVKGAYVGAIQNMNVPVLNRSRWLNAISVEIDPLKAEMIRTLHFVKAVKPMKKYQVHMGKEETSVAHKTNYNPGYADGQITMMNLDVLHKNGYNGSGITIAVLDNGFRNVDDIEGFSHLFSDNRILATYDFVQHDEDVYDMPASDSMNVDGHGNHGTWVLSFMAGHIPNFYLGAAPAANYMLFRTENDSSETHQEEDNWVAAAELADSLGADIITTSLGYSDGMTLPDTNYWYKDMDGNTTIITIGADIAASKGMLVVSSAGNAGSSAWKYITAPADGDSVLAVGAVDTFRVLAGFSSRGPTFDGRIKPDLCAMGVGAYFITTTGDISKGNGTSFSCPMMSGFAACLWQTKPAVSNMNLMQAMIQSGDRYPALDTNYGNGIPNAVMAYQLIHGISIDTILPNPINPSEVLVFPNPVGNTLNIVIENEGKSVAYRMEIFDNAGRRLLKKEFSTQPFFNSISFDIQNDIGIATGGRFNLRITNLDKDENVYEGKLLFTK